MQREWGGGVVVGGPGGRGGEESDCMMVSVQTKGPVRMCSHSATKGCGQLLLSAA